MAQNLIDYMKTHPVILDGGTGTLLQAAGLIPGTPSEEWNLTHPDEVTAIHRAYYDAGSNVAATNTFGVNGLKYSPAEVKTLVSSAVSHGKQARNESRAPQEKFIALDIGPLGKLLAPYGEVAFEDAVAAFAETVRAGVEAGVDLIFIETMNDLYETKAALLAAKENADCPVFVSNAYSENGRLLGGSSPLSVIATLEGMGADAIGVNCSFGPDALLPVVKEYLRYASVPVLMKPNAGLPTVRDGKTVFDVDAGTFAESVVKAVDAGVGIVGGCCGTTPEYIRALVGKIGNRAVSVPEKKHLTVVSSATSAVLFHEKPILIGERINPTGTKRFRQALAEHDMGYLQSEAIREDEAGCHILDVNVGTPETDEKTLLPDAVLSLQSVTGCPLQIDSSDPVAMERALRLYHGKAMINSVNGKAESMAAVFPLQKKYGGVVVALTLDENGIPDNADGRVAIAEKILREAERYGISKDDIVFDPLTLTVSADQQAARVTLDALRRIRYDLGAHTVLGVSNVSFGLPERDTVNSAFYALALENGLSAAILNPFSKPMTDVYHAFCLLRGLDENCAGYLAYADGHKAEAPLTLPTNEAPTPSVLMHAVMKGQCDEAERLTKALIATHDPLSLIGDAVIPALDEIGRGFEAKTVFLPSLLMAAEAASRAFEIIKTSSGGTATKRGLTVVLATVRGDIHDIGKNIVRLLLENYGFDVVDLGKDVKPENVAETARSVGAKLVGLSALMTTTTPAMAETVALLHRELPEVKVVVGGAVLNEEFAAEIGADAYAADAMETVRYAESLL